MHTACNLRVKRRRPYGMLTFTRKKRLAAFVGPQLSVKCTLYRIVRTWCGNRAPSGSAGGPPAYFKAVDEWVELRFIRSLRYRFGEN